MKLHTVFITHNRLELTKLAIASYLETVTVPFAFVVADNGSTDGTREWLSGMREEWPVWSGLLLLPDNHYPGYACNRGWRYVDFDVVPSLPGHTRSPATHLHRADNDFIFLPGWCDEVERMFAENPSLGQLGLRTDKEELNAPLNVGGNCVLRRELWDDGLRWDERTWPQLRDQIGDGWTEDSVMSKAVKKMRVPGRDKAFYIWDRVERPCIQPISEESMDDSYYRRSWADRGITETRDAYRPS